VRRPNQAAAAVRAGELDDIGEDLPPLGVPDLPMRGGGCVSISRSAVRAAAIRVGSVVAALVLNFGSQALGDAPGPPVCAATMKPPTEPDGNCPAPSNGHP
jgi:hypothetical protein